MRSLNLEGDEIQPRRSEGDDEFTVEDEIPQAAGDHLIDWFDPETETTGKPNLPQGV